MRLDFSKFKFSDESDGAMRTSATDIMIKNTIQSYSNDFFEKTKQSINNMNSNNIVNIYKDLQERISTVWHY